MKKTRKHNIKNISFLALTFSALSLAGCNAVKASNSNVVDEIPQAYVMQQKVVMPKKAYGDNLSLPGSYTYEDYYRVAEHYLTDPSTSPSGDGELVEIENAAGYMTSLLNSETTTQITKFEIQQINPHSNVNNEIRFTAYYDNNNSSDTIVRLYPGEETKSTSNSWTLTLTTYPEEFYYELTNEEPPAPSMGEQIVDGIESGLGMIGTLASEFLAGFGALFYVNNQLTPFAIFSLVFLGIAITFAIIKLCLNIVRSNTGA